MQYAIPITINHRREINAEFNNAAKLSNPQHFIVELADSDAVQVMQINAKNMFTCFVENEFDIALHDIEVDGNLLGNEATIHLYAKEQLLKQEAPIIEEKKKEHFYEDILNATAGKPKPKEDPIISSVPIIAKVLGNINTQIAVQLRSDANGVQLSCVHTAPITAQLFESNELAVKIILHANQQEYVFAIGVSLAHPSQFLGIALDFGSESSQMATKRYEVGNVIYEDKPSIENLFQQIKLFYTNNKWIERNEQASYYQEDKGSNFYKSLFFLREHLTDNYEDIDASEFIKSQAENLKLLIDTNSMQELVNNKFHQLPNLKIIHQHNEILSSINFEFNDAANHTLPLTLKEIKQKVNNTILKTMLESFLQKEFLRYKNATRFVRLLLLVPNIYDSANIQNTKIQLNKIFAELSNSEAYKGKLLAWEVLTISESDASFIGYINRKNAVVNKNKDYIIVDVGKGTTDFSIIRTGAENIFDLQPIYRNGFAGAGNLITNAIFETLLHYIREASNGESGVNRYMQTKIIDELKGNNLVLITKFYAEIERLKFNFKTDNVDVVFADWANAKKLDSTWSNVASNDVDFQTIIDLLGQMEFGGDLFGYINDVCEAITEKVIAHLSMMQQNKTDHDFDGVVLTGRGFMFAPLAAMMKSKLQSRLQIGENKIALLSGSELKDICIKGVFNKSIQQNTDVVGHPIQIIKGEAPPPIKEAKVISKKWFEYLVGSIEASNTDKKVFVKKDANLQLEGLQTSEFIIGATAYNLGNKSIADNVQPASKATINYTSTGFKIRRMLQGKVEKIIPLSVIHDYDEVELKLIVPSLFPNYINTNYLRCLNDDLKGLPITAKQSNTTFNPLLFDTNTPPPPPATNDLLF
jgi:hypothetical protein